MQEDGCAVLYTTDWLLQAAVAVLYDCSGHIFWSAELNNNNKSTQLVVKLHHRDQQPQMAAIYSCHVCSLLRYVLRSLGKENPLFIFYKTIADVSVTKVWSFLVG